jgi:hypothetical protein
VRSKAKLSPDLLQRALDLQRCLRTHADIAAELGVCRETISRALARINRKAAERLAKRRAETRARQVDQLEWIAAEAAAAWERSLADAEMTRTTTETAAPIGDAQVGAETEKTVKTVKGQTGNPALLRECREALADIRDILGADDGHDQVDDDYSIDLAPEDPSAQQTDGASA